MNLTHTRTAGIVFSTNNKYTLGTDQQRRVIRHPFAALLTAVTVLASCPSLHAATISPGGDDIVGTLTEGGTALRFIDITRSSFTNGEGTLHVGEIEAFAFGASFVTPNVQPSVVIANTNDLALGVPQGGNAVFTTLSGTPGHGADADVISGIRNTGGTTWTRAPVGGFVQGRVDLGTTANVSTIRVWQRADSCCQGRLAEFDIDLFDDDGFGSPGVNVFSLSHAGTVTPTNGALTINLPDDYTLFDDDILKIEFDGASDTSDTLQIGSSGLGTLTIETNATLELKTLDDFNNYSVGDVFQILDAGTINGSFGTIIQSPEVTFDLTSLLLTGEVTVLSVVPEPSTAALLGIGTVGLVLVRRRRRCVV